MKTLHQAAAKALAVLDSFALHIPEILSGPDYEIATELRSALKLSEQAATPLAYRKKGSDGMWHLFHQATGWKDCSGFEPLFTHPTPSPAPTTRPLTPEEEEMMQSLGVTGKCVRVLAFNDRPNPVEKSELLAPVQAPVDIEQIASERYKVLPSHDSMFHRWAVVAGDGTQQLYLGREAECLNMARKFAGAFLDGAYLSRQTAVSHVAGIADMDGSE